MSAESPGLCVEVVYAGAVEALCRSFRVAAPATVADVLALAAGCGEFAQVLRIHDAVGIFGRRVGPGDPVQEGDRLEIYRPLPADPKNARRTRARAAVSRSGRS